VWVRGRAGKNVIYRRYGRVQWQFFSNPVKNLRFHNRQEVSLLVEQL